MEKFGLPVFLRFGLMVLSSAFRFSYNSAFRIRANCPVRLILENFRIFESKMSKNFKFTRYSGPVFGNTKEWKLFLAFQEKVSNCGLATLLEGAGYFFNISKVNSQTFILLWCKKCEKLEKEGILVINGVSTTYLWRKNEEKANCRKLITLQLKK